MAFLSGGHSLTGSRCKFRPTPKDAGNIGVIHTDTIRLDALLDPATSDAILAGKVLGRVVVDCTPATAN
jgi:hypothetical protein